MLISYEFIYFPIIIAITYLSMSTATTRGDFKLFSLSEDVYYHHFPLLDVFAIYVLLLALSHWSRSTNYQYFWPQVRHIFIVNHLLCRAIITSLYQLLLLVLCLNILAHEVFLYESLQCRRSHVLRCLISNLSRDTLSSAWSLYIFFSVFLF